MLAGAISYVALIALVAMTILSAGLAMTRMTAARVAQSYISVGYQRAAASLQSSIAEDMQHGGIPNPAPTFTPLPPQCLDAACTYRASENIAIDSEPAATPGPKCDPLQTICAANIDTNTYVAENRIEATIRVDIIGTSGAPVATRSANVLLRTLIVPPYAVIAGSRDAIFDALLPSAGAGDDGGDAPATPNPCATSSIGNTDDTAIRVAYRTRVTNACSSGSRWADASYGAPTTGSWNP